MLSLHALNHDYNLRGRSIKVLQDITYTFAAGSFTSIRGASGSGKSTLLNILGLLETQSSGQYLIGDNDASKLTDRNKSQLRAQTFGYLFQDFRLIPALTVLENIQLSLDITAKLPPAEREKQSLLALHQVGLAERAEHLPAELSGGEAQRVAFARAMVKQPLVLLADEPTGNLDKDNRDHLLALISTFHSEGGTIVMVTHDKMAAQQSETQLWLEDGQLVTFDGSTHERAAPKKLASR